MLLISECVRKDFANITLKKLKYPPANSDISGNIAEQPDLKDSANNITFAPVF